MRVYLDNAATTPIRKEVVDVMVPFLAENFGNPSSIHAEGRKVKAAIEEARKTIAHAIGASIGEIFFTSGGTESNNMALRCSVRDLGVKRIISSPIEHHCVLHVLDHLEEEGVVIDYVEVDEKGNVKVETLIKHLKEDKGKNNGISNACQ